MWQEYTRTYVYGLGLVSQMDEAGAQTYFLVDGLGSTRAQTDDAGNVIATYNYDAFGGQRTGSGPTSTDYRYTGQQIDEPLGSYYYLRARLYDPGSGRFLSKDPFPGLLSAPAPACTPMGMPRIAR